MPNTTITFAFGHGGKDQTDTYYKIQTDANGSFVFNRRLRRNQFLGTISINCDSGSYGKRYDCYNCGGGFGSKTDMEIILL